jgi:hypothetical protein
VKRNAILDLDEGIGQAAYHYEYDLLSESLEPIGVIHPTADSITNDTSATIKRALRGFTMTSNDMRDVNPSTDRVRISMVLEDKTRWPMGVFMFTDPSNDTVSSHAFFNATLVDQSLRINQQLRWPFGVSRYDDLTQALVRIVEQMGIFTYDIDLPVAPCGSDIGWPDGTLALQVMTEIVQMAGAVGPYFSNDGRLTARLATPLFEAEAIDYPTGKHSRIVRDSLHLTKRFTDAPNVYVVEATDLGTAPVVATAFIDARLEHSIERIGYERPDVEEIQGLVDSDHALRVVRNKAETDPRQLDKADFDSSPDPRHDTYNVVQADSVLYRELSWTQSLITPNMSHSVSQQSGDLRVGLATQ